MITDPENFTALDPFFRLIEKGLEGLVDGPHFFDLLDEDVIVDYVISVPGYPRRVVGREAVAELYRNYEATGIVLQSTPASTSSPTTREPCSPRASSPPRASSRRSRSITSHPSC